MTSASYPPSPAAMDLYMQRARRERREAFAETGRRLIAAVRRLVTALRSAPSGPGAPAHPRAA